MDANQFMKELLSKKVLVLLSITVLLGISKNTWAQDPNFSQFYGNPLYLNPAMAGTNFCPRVVMNYRNQWPGLDGTVYATYAASYDEHIDEVHGGIGVSAYRDVAGLGSLTTTQVSAMYSYLLDVTPEFHVKFGLQATWFQKGIDWSALTFGDMIDRRKGFVYETQETKKIDQKQGWDFSTGLFAWYQQKYYGGVAVHHLTQPDEGLLAESKLPIKFTVHAGAVFDIGSGSDKRYAAGRTSLSPNILYKSQQDFRELNIGLYLKTRNFVAGLWHRNRDAFIVLIGVQQPMFNIGYSYDVTVSGLTNATAGAHELSFAVKFKCRNRKATYDLTHCPQF